MQRDMTRDRLRHLLSSAILELWKKETGSHTSVGIEGTVCITSQNGRTTTIQVSDPLPCPMLNRDNNNVQQEVNVSNNSDTSVSNDQNSPQSRSSSKDYPTANGQASLFSSFIPEASPVNRNVKLSANGNNARISSRIKSCVTSEKSNHQSKKVCRNLWRGDDEEADTWNRRDRAVNVNGANISRAPLPNVIKDDNNNNEVETSNTDLSPASFRWSYARRHEDDINVVDRSSDEDDDLSASSDLDGSSDSKSPLRNAGVKLQLRCQEAAENDDDDKNDSAIQDMSLDLSFSDCNNSKFIFPPCTPIATHHKRATAVRSSAKKAREKELEGGQVVENGNVGDHTIKGGFKDDQISDVNRPSDSDLYLSSPDSYTAQVRDAIRRQILANTGRPLLPLFPPSPLGVSDRSPTSWNHVHPSLSSDSSVKTIRETPYTRTASSIFWAPSTPTRLETKCSVNFHAPGPSQMDFKLFVPFLQPPNIHYNNKAMATAATSAYEMVAPPPCLSSITLPCSNQSINSIHPSLLNHVTDTPRREKVNESGVSFDNEQVHQSETVQTPVRDFKDQCGGDAGNVEQRVYRCDYCSKTFLFKSKYHEHLPVHTSARPFKCDRCSRTYKYKYDLRVHLRTHLGIPTKSTVCPFCTDKFGTNKLLRAHIKESHREQQLIGEEQCARSLEGLAAVRERNIEQDILEGKPGQKPLQINEFPSVDGHRENFLNQEGLDLSKPDGRFKSPKKDNNECLEHENAGKDFRLHISS